MISITNKKFRKFTLIPIISVIIIIPVFYFITNSIESQRSDLRVEVLSKYFPDEVFRQDPGWKGINADRTSDKVISKIPELTFVQEYYDVEISSGKFEPTM